MIRAAESTLRAEGPAPHHLSRAGLVLLLGFLLLGTLLRWVALEERPLHGDEAVGASLSRQFLETGSQPYQSANRHGPLQYYLGGLAMAALGESNFAIRFPHALAGCLFPLALWGFRRRFSEGGWLAACSLLSFSPSFVYFSRYAIQEIDFVLATALLLVCGFRFSSSGSRSALLGVCLAAAWMVSLKETFVIVWGCLAMSATLGAFLGGRRYRESLRHIVVRLRNRPGTLFLGLATALFLVIGIYTDGFRESAGLYHLFRNLREMLNLGAVSSVGGELHAHSLSFYLKILGTYEWPILILAFIGLIRAFSDRDPFSGTLALYALLVTAVHFGLAYKTPWLLLTPLLPLTLLAGRGAEKIMMGRPPLSLLGGGGIVLSALLLLSQAFSLNFLRASDPSEPLVYHPTSAEQVALADDIRAALRPLSPDDATPALISLPYVWPLAWYLRDIPNIHYLRAASPPPDFESLKEYEVLVTLEHADHRFLKGFLGIEAVPPFSAPGYESRTYVLIPPRYNVARLWVRFDLSEVVFTK